MKDALRPAFTSVGHCVPLRYSDQIILRAVNVMCGSVAEWLACWTQAQKARVQIAVTRLSVTVLGELFTPIVPLFTKQQNW